MFFAQALIIVSESSGSKSPFGSSLKFLRNLSNSKTTKGIAYWVFTCLKSRSSPDTDLNRWPTSKTKRAETRQQARTHSKAGAKSASAEVNAISHWRSSSLLTINFMQNPPRTERNVHKSLGARGSAYSRLIYFSNP